MKLLQSKFDVADSFLIGFTATELVSPDTTHVRYVLIQLIFICSNIPLSQIKDLNIVEL